MVVRPGHPMRGVPSARFPLVTLIAGRRGRLTRQPYFGPVVFTGGADEHGTTQGLIYTFIDQLERDIRTAAASSL